MTASEGPNEDKIMPTVSAAENATPMRLRADAPRVTRISRRVLAGLGLVAGVGIGGALIFALQSTDRIGGQPELISTERRQTADGLQGLPGNYADVPRLGPPLPGDLGGPILSAQDRGQSVAPVMTTPAADPDEQRRLAEQEAARTSQIFFQVRPGQDATIPSSQPISGAAVPGAGGAGGQDRHLAFLNAEVDRLTVAADRVMAPASPYILQAGSVIPAALITGIRSDLPGQITAQVTQNVYDSPTGSLLLIPQGSRRRQWRKIHIGIDAETLEVRAVEMTSNRVGDAPVLPDLLAQIPAEDRIGSVTADGIYDTKGCHTAIAARGADAIIPPRRNARGWKGHGPGLQTLRSGKLEEVVRISPTKSRRGQDEMHQAPRRAQNGQRLRQAGCRGSDPHRTHEPLHLTRHARDCPHALKISAKGTNPNS